MIEIFKNIFSFRDSKFIPIFILWGVVIIFGVAYYFYFVDEIKDNFRNVLIDESGIRGEEIERWREAKLEEGYSIRNDKLVEHELDLFIRDRKNSNQAGIISNWLNGICKREDYSKAFLVDTGEGKILLSGGEEKENYQELRDDFDSLKNRDVFF